VAPALRPGVVHEAGDADRRALIGVADRRTKDRLSDAQWAFQPRAGGLRALVEQSIAHLAGAWALRRWRGPLYRVRGVFRATGALICLGRWLHRVPT
jgi:hypothetical protein